MICLIAHAVSQIDYLYAPDKIINEILFWFIAGACDNIEILFRAMLFIYFGTVIL